MKLTWTSVTVFCWLFGESNGLLRLRKSQASEDANPLLERTELPRFADVSAAGHARQAVTAALNDAQHLTRALESKLSTRLRANKSISFDDIFPELHAIYDGCDRPWGRLQHLQSVKDEPALREAIVELEPKVVQFYQELGQSQILYAAIVQIKGAHTYSDLPVARQRIVAKEARDRVLSGVALKDEAAKEFNVINQQLSKLSSVFSHHVLDATAAWNLTLFDVERVRGIPKRTLEFAAAEARKNGFQNATGDAGPWIMTLDPALLSPVLANAKNRDLRQTLFWASTKLASFGPTDNTPTINEILAKRQRSAELLGYKNYAELSFASKMAKSGQVHELLHEIQQAASARAHEELDELRAFAKKSDGITEMKPWDKAYYIESMKKERFTYDTEELRAYFAFPAVLDGVFALSARLFGTKFDKVRTADAEHVLWHRDVSLYKVMKDGQFKGYVFVDPYSRPGQKQAGAWVQPLISRSRERGMQELRHPVAAVILNFPSPQGHRPSLLSVSEVETLYHEFGHALQHILTEQDDSAVAGLNGIEWDAVEIASQFMEYWVSEDRSTLYSMARHIDSGKPLPDELYKNLRLSKNFRAASTMVGQVYLGSVDLHLHEKFHKGEDVFEVDRKIATSILPEPPLKDERHLCAFSHIFAGGYAAGYYSYQWSKVLSADAFSAFEEAGGLSNETHVQATGRRFAATMLALGGGRTPGSVFKDFRGRQSSISALLKYSGLDAK